MKRLVISLALLLSVPTLALAGAGKDSLQIKEIHLQERKEQVKKVGIRDSPVHPKIYQRSQNPRFRGHWSGFNLGFASFAREDMPPGESSFMDLQRENSLVMQFNFVQFSTRLNKKNNLGFVTGFGLEYQRLRFKHKNSITRGENGHILPLNMERVKKSSLKNLYLTVPLICEWQFPAKQYSRAYIGAGIVAGLRLYTRTKVVYKNEDGEYRRVKRNGNYSMNPVKADAVVRVGYGQLALWGSYTLTRVMKSGKAPDLHTCTMGFGINF